MRVRITLTLLLLAILATQSSLSSAQTTEILRTAVVAALDTLVAELVQRVSPIGLLVVIARLSA